MPDDTPQGLHASATRAGVPLVGAYVRPGEPLPPEPPGAHLAGSGDWPFALSPQPSHSLKAGYARYATFHEFLKSFTEFWSRLHGRPFTNADMEAAALDNDHPGHNWGNWTKPRSRGGRLPNPEQILRIHQTYLLPMEAMLRLRFGGVTHVNFDANRFYICPYFPGYVSRGGLVQRLWTEDGETPDGTQYRVLRLGVHPHQSAGARRYTDLVRGELLDHQRKLMRHKAQLHADVLRAAADYLPSLNLRIEDHLGHYLGHIITLGLNAAAVQALRVGQWGRAGTRTESALTVADLARVDHGEPVAGFLIYSMLAVETTHAYRLVAEWTRAFWREPMLARYLTSRQEVWVMRFATTMDALAMCRAFGLTELAPRPDVDYQRAHGTHVVPYFCAARMQSPSLAWLRQPRADVAGFWRVLNDQELERRLPDWEAR